MPAIILTWNPGTRDDWESSYSDVIDLITETGRFDDICSVGRRKNITIGTEAWLLRQGALAHGLVGHGVVTSEPARGEPVAASTRSANYVNVSFDALLPSGEEVPTSVLLDRVPGVSWKPVHSSGISIRPGDEQALRAVWAEYAPPSRVDPTLPTPGSLPECALTRVAVNRYERNPSARDACIASHGISCYACGLNFETVYGEIGRNFIHVHHIVPVSELGPGYQLDPLTDLVPLCPNCHAMAHQRSPSPYTPAELRRRIARSGYLPGEIVSHEQQQAHDEARRILGKG